MRRSDEEWRQVILSRIRVTDRGCWEWLGARFPNGYGCVNFNRQSHGTHRLAWKLFRGPIPEGRSVLHHCDNKICINFLDHLYLGTVLDNARDAVARGRYLSGDDNPSRAHPERLPRGEKHGRSTLTESIVKQIKHLYSEGASTQQIAAWYGLSQGGVHSVVVGRTWRHIPCPGS
jgi:hypothetical protein